MGELYGFKLLSLLLLLLFSNQVLVSPGHLQGVSVENGITCFAYSKNIFCVQNPTNCNAVQAFTQLKNQLSVINGSKSNSVVLLSGLLGKPDMKPCGSAYR